MNELKETNSLKETYRIKETSKLDRILQKCVDLGASDIHLTVGKPVSYRINGEILQFDEVNLTPEELIEICGGMMTKQHVMDQINENGEVDFAYSYKEVCRFRINMFRQRGNLAAAMRLLPMEIPKPNELGLPQSVVDLTKLQRGLILITGATGTGKSTTIASLIDVINSTQRKHIITVEDPIEYIHKHKIALVNQREVGSDTLSFDNALRSILREDPDVIFIGEMRDLETIEIALTAAETGHLVFSTLHTNSASASIDRIIDAFPPNKRDQIRIQLAGVLEGICCQQLIRTKNERGRLAAFEVLLATPAIRNLIREGKSYQLTTQIQTGKKLGMITMDESLYNMYLQNKISADDCIRYSQNYQDMQKKVQGFFEEQ